MLQFSHLYIEDTERGSPLGHFYFSFYKGIRTMGEDYTSNCHSTYKLPKMQMANKHVNI